jgi:hypothetical protein
MLKTEILNLLDILKQNLINFENNNNIQEILISHTILTTIINLKKKIIYIINFKKKKYILPKDTILLSNRVFDILKNNLKEIL